MYSRMMPVSIASSEISSSPVYASDFVGGHARFVRGGGMIPSFPVGVV
jgi:hypothetical protein